MGERKRAKPFFRTRQNSWWIKDANGKTIRLGKTREEAYENWHAMASNRPTSKTAGITVGFVIGEEASACLHMLALVSATTIMGVQDRIKEHAVLQTLGCTSFRIFRRVLGESILVSLLGGLMGIAAALLTLRLTHLSLGAEGVLIAFLPSFRLALTGTIVSAVVGILTSIIPAWPASRAEIVTAFRA